MISKDFWHVWQNVWLAWACSCGIVSRAFELLQRPKQHGAQSSPEMLQGSKCRDWVHIDIMDCHCNFELIDSQFMDVC